MHLKSKFSNQFLAKNIFFTTLFIIIIIACTINYFNDDLKTQERTTFLIIDIIVSGIFIGLTIDIFKTFSISLDDEKITVQYIITNKKEFFYYEDFRNIVSNRNQPTFRGIQLNDGYFSRIYQMKDEKLLEISPSVFENYDDLVYNISINTSHLE